MSDFPDESKSAKKRGRKKYHATEDPYDPAIGILPDSEIRRLLRAAIPQRTGSLSGKNMKRRPGQLTISQFIEASGVLLPAIVFFLYDGGVNVGETVRRRLSQFLLRLNSGHVEITPEKQVVVHETPVLRPPIVRRVVFTNFSNRPSGVRIPVGSPMHLSVDAKKRSPSISVVQAEIPKPRTLLKKW